jgi:hypothetical protein
MSTGDPLAVEWCTCPGREPDEEQSQLIRSMFGDQPLCGNCLRPLRLSDTRTDVPDPELAEMHFGVVEDGTGGVWPRCRLDCGMEIVSLGKVMCSTCEETAGATSVEEALENGACPMCSGKGTAVFHSGFVCPRD